MKYYYITLHMAILSVVEVPTDQSHVDSNPGDNVSQCKHTYNKSAITIQINQWCTNCKFLSVCT